MSSIPLPSGDRLATDFDPVEKTHVLRATSSGGAGPIGHAAGDGDAAVSVPEGARVRTISCIAGSSGATITVRGQDDPIVVPADGGFDELYPLVGENDDDVEFEGVVAYYVSWGG